MGVQSVSVLSVLFLTLALLQGKHSSQFFAATWCLPHRRQSSIHISGSRAGPLPAPVLPALSQPSTNAPGDHSLLQSGDLHHGPPAGSLKHRAVSSSAPWGSSWLSAARPLSHQCPLRVAGFQPANVPRAKGSVCTGGFPQLLLVGDHMGTTSSSLTPPKQKAFQTLSPL